MKNYLTCLIFLVVAGYTFAQNTLRGVIKNENNVAVAGATVKVDGSDLSTITNQNGEFAGIVTRTDLIKYLFNKIN